MDVEPKIAVLADEDIEEDPDRWCSYTECGQEPNIRRMTPILAVFSTALPARLTAHVLVPRSRPLQTLPALFRAAVQGPILRGLPR